MAKQKDFGEMLETLFAQMGSEVARGIADGIARSGIMKRLGSLARGANRIAQSTTQRRAGRRRKKPKRCSARGCNQPARAKGFCTKHYQRQRYAEKRNGSGGTTHRRRLPGRLNKKAIKLKPSPKSMRANKVV